MYVPTSELENDKLKNTHCFTVKHSHCRISQYREIQTLKTLNGLFCVPSLAYSYNQHTVTSFGISGNNTARIINSNDIYDRDLAVYALQQIHDRHVVLNTDLKRENLVVVSSSTEYYMNEYDQYPVFDKVIFHNISFENAIIHPPDQFSSSRHYQQQRDFQRLYALFVR